MLENVRGEVRTEDGSAAGRVHPWDGCTDSGLGLGIRCGYPYRASWAAGVAGVGVATCGGGDHLAVHYCCQRARGASVPEWSVGWLLSCVAACTSQMHCRSGLSESCSPSATAAI